MTFGSRWLIPVAVVGATAAVMAAALFWLVMTQPVAAARAIGQAF